MLAYLFPFSVFSLIFYLAYWLLKYKSQNRIFFVGRWVLHGALGWCLFRAYHFFYQKQCLSCSKIDLNQYQVNLDFGLLVITISFGLVVINRFFIGIWKKIFVGAVLFTLIIGMRNIFLDQDDIWPIYMKAFKNVDQTVKNQLKIRRGQLLENGPYFFLGDSQTQMIVAPVPNISYLRFYGLSVYEYPFFISQIKSLNPEAVILYFSEVNMTRGYDLRRILYIPDNRPYLISLLKRYVINGDEEDYTKGIREAYDPKMKLIERFYETCLVAYQNLIPELKYSRLFRQLVETNFEPPKTQTTQKEVKKEKVSAKRIAQNINKENHIGKGVLRRQSKRLGTMPYVEKDWLALEKFISALKEDNIDVIILEGQYHPDVMSLPIAVEANRIFKNRIIPIVKKYPNALFISREQQMIFSANDFDQNDWLHIQPDAAKRYYKNFLYAFLSQRFG